MIPISKAIDIIKRETVELEPETVAISQSVGRILSQEILADTDLPPFDRSQMDGFAVRAKDTEDPQASLRIIGESAAGAGFDGKLKSGEAVRIMTGARVPKGADAVQKLESAIEFSQTFGKASQSRKAKLPIPHQVPKTTDSGNPDLSNEIFVKIHDSVEKGNFIVPKGFEIKKGEIIFRKGEIVTPNMIASLAAFGYSMVDVSIQPNVAILATGSEIVAVNETPGKDQIRDSNSIMLKVLCEKAGARAELFPLAGDNLESLKAVISKTAGVVPVPSNGGENIAYSKFQILIITGGVSVGKYDYTKYALRELGAEIFFERVRLKPGKPTVFAKLGDMLIFGLPGNPVSAAVTFYLFVRTAILRMQKGLQTGLKPGFAILASPVKAAGERDTYAPASLETDKGGSLIAKPLKWHGSSDFIGFSRAEALIRVPKGKSYEKDTVVEIVFL